MIVANQKKKENIAEYVLYMWHTEDLIRSFNFDIDLLENKMFGIFSEDRPLREEIRNWYLNLGEMMEMENIKKEGHLQITKNIVLDLNTLHVNLIKSPEEIKYRDFYFKAAPNLFEFQKKITDPETNEVEMMLIGMYGLLMMRMKKVPVKEETERALKTFSDLLAILSNKYHEREKKEREEMTG